MNKKLKTVVIILGFGFLVFLTLNIILNKLLSEESLKSMLIVPAQKELGREVTIGSAKASLLSGITITDIAIKERDSDQDFISVKTFRLNYKLLPLLQKQLVIKEVLIDEPMIRIIRGSDGLFNFADIGQQHSEKEDELAALKDNEEIEPFPFSVTLNQVNINKATLSLTDKTDVLPEVHSEADLAMSVTLGKTLAETKFNGSFNLLANGEYRGHRPVLQVACSISEKLLSYKGNLTVGFDKVEVDGNAANYLSSPVIELNIDISTIDLDKLASLKQFISDKSGQEQADQPASQSPAPEEEAVNLNFSALGKVRIDKITSGRIKMQDVSLLYKIKENIITLNEISTSILGGSINGDLTADISKEQPSFQGQLNGKEIKVSKIMTALEKPDENLSGTLAAELSFQGSGKEWSVIQQDLSAEGRFSIVDGAMQHTPLTTALATLLNIQKLSDLKFSDFSGNFTIADGKMTLDSNMQTQGISLMAEGDIGLDGTLDMPLTLQLAAEYADNSTFASYLADEQGQATLYLNAKGSIQKPRLTMDRKAVKKQVTKVIEKKIVEEIGRLISKSKDQPDTANDQDQDLVKDMSEMLLKQLTGN